jgi:glutamate mutase epsilon subunit
MFILNICNNQSIKNIHAAAIINSEIAASNAYYAYMYSYNIIGDRFELGEEAIAKSAHWSYNYAVMIDPFRPLKITEEAMKVEDKSYATSWLDTEENYLHDRSQE